MSGCSVTTRDREDKFSRPILLKDVNLIDGTGGEIQRNVSVFIKNGIIQEVFNSSNVLMDTSIMILDLEGMYLLPGLIEAHSHICRSTEEDLTKALYFGITSLRDMAGDGAYLAELQQAIKSNELQAPDIYFSAVMAGSEFITSDARARIATPEYMELGKAPWMQEVDDETNIRKAIKNAKRCGATGLKLYADLSPQLVKKLAKEAHNQGIMVWSHAFIGSANVLDVSEAEVDAISHITSLLYHKDWNLKRDGSMAIDETMIQSDYFQQCIKNLQQKKVIMDATISIYKSYCNNDNEIMNIIYSLTNLVYRSGIPLVTGTDNSLILKRLNKPALYDEIITFANDCGIPPLETIKCATKNGAVTLGIDKTHGTIEKGKVANMILLKENPLKKIENIESIIMVIKNGEIIRSDL